MTTTKIYEGLKLVKLKGQKFKGNMGYYEPNNHCLYHPQLGYLAFKGSQVPYSPQGGRKLLKQMLEGRGFSSFDGMVWLQPMK